MTDAELCELMELAEAVRLGASELQARLGAVASSSQLQEAGPLGAQALFTLDQARTSATETWVNFQAAGVLLRRLSRNRACAQGDHVGVKSGFKQCVHCGTALPAPNLREPTAAANDDREVANG